MHSAVNNRVFPQKLLRNLFKPKFIICLDLDGTLFDASFHGPHWYLKLDKLLHLLLERKLIQYGVITGSNSVEALNKLNKMLRLYLQAPLSFVATGFGTHLYYLDDMHHIYLDEEWAQLVKQSYSKEKIKKIVKILADQQIHLIPESRSKNPLKDSFYFIVDGKPEMTLKVIKKIVDYYKIKVIISKCNPENGDLENAYDIDFIPIFAGKERVLNYLLNQFDLEKQQSIVFGDSKNDLAILMSAGKGFAVANATVELKAYPIDLCRYGYAQGIYHTLIQLFADEI
jgi:kanosamine-6-phosphate phosphatase